MIKVAIIGAGTMGKVHSDAFLSIPQVQLVGIVDKRLEEAESLAQERGTAAYQSLDELLKSEKPDIIDVCLPTYLHREYVEKIARLGLHVICEKPIARNLEDAREMIEICKREGVQLFIAHVVRFFPEYVKAKQLLDTGSIGQIGTVRTMRGGIFPTGWNDWYANVEQCGTLIMDMIIHDFDFLRWCFGEVERVYAKSLMGRDFNRLDHAFVSLRFQNGVIAHVEGAWSYPEGFRTELEIAGAQGMIEHNSEEAVAVHISRRASSNGAQGVAVPESPLQKSPYQLELEHFIECLQQDKEPIVTAEDAYKALEISLAALDSIYTGQPVCLQGGIV